MHWIRRHRTGRPPHPDVLTPAEWRVLEHVREGLPNAEIAVRLGVSINTVRTHVSSMLAKLDLPDRHALARWQGEPAEASRHHLERTRFALPFADWPSLLRLALGGGAAVVGVVVLWWAIGMAQDGGARDEGSAGIAPTPTPALTATEEPPLVHLVDGIPVGAVGPLLVYMYPIAQEAFQSLNYPIYRLVIYDVGRSLPVSSFTIGERGRLVSSVLLAHREIYVNYTHEIAVYTLDGSEDRLLYSMPDDLLEAQFGGPPTALAQSFAVSPDGERLAFALHWLQDTGWSLHTIDARTGQPRANFLPSMGAEPDTFRGLMAPLWWDDDGAELFVAGITYSDGSGPIGVFSGGLQRFTSLDVPDQRYHVLDPTGQAIAFGTVNEGAPSAPDCMFIASDRIEIMRLHADEVAVIEHPGKAVTPLEWSPDGAELLYSSRPIQPGDVECEFARRPAEFHVYSLTDEASEEIFSPVDARKRWYGSRAVWFACDGTADPGHMTWQLMNQLIGPGPACYESSEFSLLLDGQPIQTIDTQLIGITGVLGFVEVTAP